MKIFPTSDIKQLDAYTIENEPVASIDLMERAARAIVRAIAGRWSTETAFTVFAGPGNNGGDALAVARLLQEKGYRVETFLFNTKDNLSPDCALNMERLAALPDVNFHEVTTQFVFPKLTADDVIIDGLFGSGLNKSLSGGFAAVVKFINASPARVVSIDIPSGLMGEDNSFNVAACIVRADLTLSLQLPKLSFFFPENEAYVGEWRLLDIGLSEEGMEKLPTDYTLTEPLELVEQIKPRGKFAHKGNFGRALLIAGSQGMAGASILAAKACLRSGVGLLTVHVPFCNNGIVQTAVPEAMTDLDLSDTCFASPVDTDDFQAVAIGPGLGCSPETVSALIEQIETSDTPMVFDADALNILGDNRSLLSRLPKGSILTPHPVELERLVGKCRNSFERLERARELACNAEVYIVLKGAYTAVISPDKKCRFNPTGNPGMATGGSGDVLTGVLLALLAQGYAPGTAAQLGVFVHGLAGDMAAKERGVISLTAGDIVEALPQAWMKMQE